MYSQFWSLWEKGLHDVITGIFSKTSPYSKNRQKKPKTPFAMRFSAKMRWNPPFLCYDNFGVWFMELLHQNLNSHEKYIAAAILASLECCNYVTKRSIITKLGIIAQNWVLYSLQFSEFTIFCWVSIFSKFWRFWQLSIKLTDLSLTWQLLMVTKM